MAQEWAKAFYNSTAWKHTREAALKRDRYICRQPGCFRPATEVHHKKELTPENISDIKISLNLNNLISLCSECHKAITKAEHRKKGMDILPDIVFDDNGYPVPASPPRG